MHIVFVHTPMAIVSLSERESFWRNFDIRYHATHPGLKPMKNVLWELPHWMTWLAGALVREGFDSLVAWDDLGQERMGNAGPWRVTGPTCDSSDMFKKLYSLPDEIAVGDYVGFGMLGAYSPSLATRFNGYGAQDWVQIVNGASS
ncbi:hypothetical protein I9018_12065 [Pseudomonas sp. MPFS]|uniref:hypothetical protein n=2 Tax=unclassified Pseudomonas TaxID=196821 RepID=UPI001F135AA9|nr:hypothetical protein [Pseudomonas sp. MPFS]UMZ14374.1 hypothetical protein I9018_12065 [Pseudomonas sp. MPFS]